MENLFIAFVIIFGVEVLFGILINLFNYIIVQKNFDKSTEMKKELKSYMNKLELKEKFLYDMIKEVEKLKEQNND